MNISDLCKHDVVTVRPADDLLQAAQLMRTRHVGYLVVVEPALRDGTFRPIGVLSLDDVLEALADQLQNMAGSVRREQTIEGALRP